MNNITLNIQPIKQPDLMGCTTTCLKMILQYYGQKLDDKVINNEVRKDSTDATFNTEIARFAQNHGFDVDCFSYHLGIVSPGDSALSLEKLIQKLKKGKEHPWFNRDWALLVDSTIHALEDGVTYIIQKPSIDTIKSYLSLSIPLIASVNYLALHDIQGNPYSGHDIVLNGIEENNFLYIDPEKAFRGKITSEHLMFAIHSRRAISTSAYLIAIKPAS